MFLKVLVERICQTIQMNYYLNVKKFYLWTKKMVIVPLILMTFTFDEVLIL